MTGSEILIVEDEFIVAMDIQKSLEELGYTVVGRVHSGEKAIQTVQESMADLVLMDIMLKGQMTGIEAASEIRSRFDIPVIYVTANAEQPLLEQAKETEPFGFIVKPFNERELRASIEMALYKHRMEQQIRQLNEDLKHKVEVRTADLQTANNALRESLDTLQHTQEQIIQSEKMAALGRLVASISHEIKNPVGLGITAASYLEQKTREIEIQYREGTMKRSDLEQWITDVNESAIMILRNLQHAAEQIQSFNQVAVDQGSDEKRSFLLKAYLEEVLLSLRPKLRRTKHTVFVNCPDNLSIDSYPGVFSQILRNFVLNSLLHGFEDHEQGQIVLEVTRKDGMLLFRYSDNGKGMTNDQRLKIFEPFYTTKREQGGNGLGLHIVYNLVTQRLQGEITCESVPGEGTTFFIQIPLTIVRFTV